MKKNRCSEYTRKISYWLAKQYYKFEQSTVRYESHINELKQKHITIDELNELEGLYFSNKLHMDTIRKAFEDVVVKNHQRLVWDIFYGKRKPESSFEEMVYKEEVDKWLYHLAFEYGYVPYEEKEREIENKLEKSKIR